jgi:hypothetical protein
MENDLSTAIKELVESLNERNKSQVDFEARILAELHELNTTLRHLQSKFGPKEL